jgi:hypothetical protein
MTDAPRLRLSKSRFVAGWQCPKLLWWRVREPDATELQPNAVLDDLFDQGNLVGQRAREEWPQGVLIDGDHHDAERVPRTIAAIDAGATVLFEACFEEDGVFCQVDVLERRGDEWTLIEVKSSSEVKPYHLPDVAVQVHVCRRAGLNVTRAEVMHLNRAYRHPGIGSIFARSDVTQDVEGVMHEVPGRIAEQLAVLAGPLPEHAVGEHCWLHGECAFFDRCWAKDPDHIRHLWNVGPKKTMAWIAKGVHTMSTIPPGEKLNDKQKRQLLAQHDGRTVVEPGLSEAMRPALEARRLGFLDFETVARALPAWNGLGPWHQTAAQFSYHEREGDEPVAHAEFLAEGPADPSQPPDDPREAIARAMIDATANADVIVMYTPFERTQIKALANHLPHLAADLEALSAKLWDLQPAVASNVYHPDFRGSFSLKDILTPLVPGLGYSDLMIVDGKLASVKIARLLFVSGRIPPHERDQTRRDLLAYCERDTFATVRLVERLGELAKGLPK